MGAEQALILCSCIANASANRRFLRLAAPSHRRPPGGRGLFVRCGGTRICLANAHLTIAGRRRHGAVPITVDANMPGDESKASLAAARDALRAAGLRCTSCRLAVFQLLAESRSPVSHNDAADRLAPGGFDKSTIYRSLVELSEVGIANRLELGDHTWRFEIRRPHADDADHPHFMCVDCGKVTCLPEFSVQIAPVKGKKRAALGDITEVLLKGHCADCQ